MKFNFYKKNNKGFSLIEVTVAIIMVTMISYGVVLTIQSGKTLRYVNSANQDISQLQENILGSIDIMNNNNKNTIDKGTSNFSSEARTKFLTIFPSSQITLNNPNGKECYKIDLSGSAPVFTKLTLSGDLAVINNDDFVNSNLQNTEDSNEQFAYPTAICITNAFEYIDELSGKNTTSGPILLTAISAYYISGESKQVMSEKVYYFDEK